MSSDPNSILTFSQLLQVVAEGQVHHDLTKQLTEAVAAMNDARAEGISKPKASITLKLNFTLDGQNVDVDAKHSVSLPVIAPPRTVLWTTADNKLSRANPKQTQLFGKVETVDLKTGEVRTVAPA